MSNETTLALRGDKIASIILSLTELYGVSIIEATDIYYNSETSQLIEDGIADLHCRSSKYLATVIWDETSNHHN